MLFTNFSGAVPPESVVKAKKKFEMHTGLYYTTDLQKKGTSTYIYYLLKTVDGKRGKRIAQLSQQESKPQCCEFTKTTLTLSEDTAFTHPPSSEVLSKWDLLKEIIEES